MLFANRRLAANAETESSRTSPVHWMPVASIYLCGVEQLEIWLKKFPSVAHLANLDLETRP